MADIGLVWDAFYAQGDWARDGDVAMGAEEDGVGGDLAAAIMVSLFTDRRASDDFVLNDGTTNRRGCWSDSYEDEAIGSRLWQIERARTTTVGRSNAPLLLAARDYCVEALAWLKRDEIALDVDVQTFFARKDALGILVTVTLPNGQLAAVTTSLPLD